VHQNSRRQRYVPHPWIILLTTLALIALYLTEALTIHRRPAEAASALAPALSPPGGYYDQDVLLISPPHPGASVIFTVDGSVPTRTAGEIYSRPIHLSAATPGVTVIRTRAILPGDELGPVISASYFLGVPAQLPMISLIVDPGDLWDPERGIYANPYERGDTWERPVDVTYVDTDRRSGFHVPAGVRIHGHHSREFDKKSLRLYFRQEYGVSRLDYPLFAGSDVRSFKRLVLHNGGHDCPSAPRWNATLIRNQLAASLAFEVGGYATHNRPALVFINGEPWGIYHIRERIDSRLLADHHGIESADFLVSPEFIPERDILAGDREHWDHLLQFIETHDLADPASYAFVQSQVDIANFIDYNILQIYAANIDWPLHNVHQFRPRVQGGQWRWMFWDSDHGFGLTPYGVPVDSNFITQVLDESKPETSGRDTLLLQKLLENPTFLDRFLSRAADLLNTTLAPQSVIAHIDALAAELELDIAYEIMRWPRSGHWESHVEELRDFARRRPDFVRQHAVDRFNLGGTAHLTLNPPASGSGTVAVNGTTLLALPWQGVYFQGIPVQITAAPAPGYRFAGWDPPNLPPSPAITLTLDAAQAVTPRFEPLGDDAPRPGDVVFAGYQMHKDSHIEGGWFELRVTRPGGVDLRGWRVTDNDAKTAIDEGSLIFADNPALARVGHGTTIRVIVTPAGTDPPEDDLSAWDRQMVLHTGNPNLNSQVDPGFNLGPNDNLVLLAPGPTDAFGDDQGIAFVAAGTAVTPASFGVLTDGVSTTPATAAASSGQRTPGLLPAGGLVLAGLAARYLNLTVRRTIPRTR
jgi:hypothetical protein